jgi:hypothetical protein
MINSYQSFPLSIRVLVLLLPVLGISAIFPTGGVYAATHPRLIIADCKTEMHLTVTNFTGEPNGVEGTLDSFECVSSTMPEITHASVTVHGSATGTPDNLSISEIDDVTWLNAKGDPVAHSTLPLTRTMNGGSLPNREEMTMIAFGAGAPGPSGNRLVNVASGIAMHCYAGNNTWVYTNQDAGGYQDYG